MAVNISAKGTSYESFQIGTSGITIFQGTSPSGMAEHDVWINTNDGSLKVYDGAAWVNSNFDNLSLAGNTITASNGNINLVPGLGGTVTVDGDPVLTPTASTTDDLPEGSVNLYYTNTRVRNAISATSTGLGSLVYTPATGVFAYEGPSTINLGTDTTGNYVEDINTGTGISTIPGPTEGAVPTISVDSHVILDSGPQSIDGTKTFSDARATADTTQALGFATKQYVDNTVSGLDVKSSVRVATTGPITLSSTQIIDGIPLVIGDRVLVKNQNALVPDPANGIYNVQAAAWTRTTDADNNPAGEVTSGMYTFVEEGSISVDSGFVLQTIGPITLDTTPLSFVQFSGAGQIIAGEGLSKNVNTIDVNVNNGITINADNVEVDSTVIRTTGVQQLAGTKTFTSPIVIDTTNNTTLDLESGGTTNLIDFNSSAMTIGLNTGQATWSNGTATIILTGTAGSARINGDLILTDAMNFNADTLDGEDGTYYNNLANATGTLDGARFIDGSHGSRSGGNLHSNVVASGLSGFMTGADKLRLDNIADNATNVTDNNQILNGAGYVTSSGVTQVDSGAGLDFTNFTSTGTITLGNPSTLGNGISNGVTTNSHTHTIDSTIARSASPTFTGTVIAPTINTTLINPISTLVTIDGHLTVTGDMIIGGSTTTINTTELYVADNVIRLNSDFTTGTPTENAGIEVLRGNLSTVSLRWNETSDHWEQTSNGTNYYRLLDTTDTGSGNGLDADTLDGEDGTYYLDWANVTDKPDPVVELTGDVSGQATMTNLGSINITTTVDDDSHSHTNYLTGLTAGNLINVNTTMSPTIDVDLAELTTSTANGQGDYFVVVDTGNNQRKLTKGSIDLSGFENDLNWSSTTGTVIQVTGTAGLTGSVTSTGSLSHSTANGYKHIPVNGASGQFLGWDSTGTAKWVSNPNTNTWRAIDTTPVQTATTDSISSSWAYAHTAGQHTNRDTRNQIAGSYAPASHGNHVPTVQAANNAIYLRNDNTWQTISPADISAQPAGSYDNYVSWNIAANGTAGTSAITKSNTVTFSGSGATTVTRSGDNITINSTDNNTQRAINNTYPPTSTSATTSASINVARQLYTLANHGHPYDDYNGWDLQANGGAVNRITTGENVNFVHSGATTISRSGSTITISSTDTDTNTWRAITSTPSTSTSTSISASWANTHTAGQHTNRDTRNQIAGSYAALNGNAAINFNAATLTATLVNATSDETLKENIITYNGTDAVTIRAVDFEWKDKAMGADSVTGYIAQEVEKVMPEAVTTNEEGIKSVNYNAIHTAKIAELEHEVKELKALVNKLLENK